MIVEDVFESMGLEGQGEWVVVFPLPDSEEIQVRYDFDNMPNFLSRCMVAQCLYSGAAYLTEASGDDIVNESPNNFAASIDEFAAQIR